MKKITSAFIFLITISSAHAQGPSNPVESSQEYDWQACIHAISSKCINGCAISADRHCKDTCMSMAKDKCLLQGLRPTPSSQTIE